MINKKSLICFFGLMIFCISVFSGCLVSVKFVPEFYGLVIGFGSMIVSIPFALIFKDKKIMYIAVTIWNGIASGFSIGSYYIMKNVDFVLINAIDSVIICICIFILYCYATRLKFVEKYPKLFTYPVITIFLILSIIGWAKIDKSLFSYFTFMFIADIYFIFALLIVAADTKGLYKNICVCSYGALLLISIVSLLVISEGEGFDFDIGSSGLTVEAPHKSKVKFSENVSPEFLGMAVISGLNKETETKNDDFKADNA